VAASMTAHSDVTELLIDRLLSPDGHRSEILPPGDWRVACRYCVERFPYLTKRQLRFVVELARYKAPPSRKQLTILDNLVARCRNELV
jgi:hypothetical protein